jgi:protein-tyrosine phosphatase
MAEAVAAAVVASAGLDDRVSVESFGTSDYHRGEPIHPQAGAALERHGWPRGRHRARRLTADDLERLDLVLCADRDNLATVERMAARLD